VIKMKIVWSVALACLPFVLAGPSGSAETGLSSYQGAWLMQGSSCDDVYTTGSKGTTFRQPIDIFAPAFIVSGQRLRTPAATCRIKSIRSASEGRHVLNLECANTVSTSGVKVLVSLSSDGSLKRYFDEQDTTGSPYQRCSR
jgi:hypothetical protein